jgi:ribosomal-protein-serine acetyltransferase
MFAHALSEMLSLRLIEDADAEELYGLIDADREYLARWMPWAPASTPDSVREFISFSRAQHADNNGFQAVIVDCGRIRGAVGFHAVDWVHRSASIGYWLAAADQGRGVMTLAVRALVDWAFTGWKLNRVEIRAAAGNARSRAVAARLGFSEEGTLREAELVGDRFLDLVVYSVLAAEWGTTTAVPSN